MSTPTTDHDDIDMGAQALPDPATAPTTVAVDDSIDATPTQDPDDFDFAEFLTGLRPIRRRVRIYARGDLLADLDRIAQQILDVENTIQRDDTGTPLPGEEDRVAPRIEALADQWTTTKDRLDRSARWFTIRARSKEWIDAFMAQQKTRPDIGLTETINDRGDTVQTIPTEAGRVQHYAELLAEQIVSPTGVTVDGLKQLYKVADGEFNRLVGCALAANALNVPGSVGRDFSARSSAAHDGASS